MSTPAPDPKLHPQMAAVLARMQQIAREEGLGPPPADPTPQQARARMETERRWWNQDLPEMAAMTDTAIDGPHGAVPVRLLVPPGQRPLPALVYLHGGGWVVGSLETHHRAMRLLALRSGCVVVAVDYRLAPEHKFPEPLDDAVAAIRQTAARADGWGIDSARIALGGDSAGANLALAAALRLRDAGEGGLAKSLILFYGAYGDDDTTESYRAFGDGSYGLGAASMRWYWNHYLRGPADRADPLAMPLKAPDLSGLPPTHLYAAGCDPLRDDSVAMAARLRAAGVPGRLQVYDGVIHAFINQSRMLDRAHELIADAAADVRAGFA